MAQKVQITFGMPMEEDHDHGNVGFDMGLANLSSLQEVNVAVYCHGITVGEARMVEAKLTQALHDHHNHPRFKIDIQPPISDEGTKTHLQMCSFITKFRVCMYHFVIGIWLHSKFHIISIDDVSDEDIME